MLTFKPILIARGAYRFQIAQYVRTRNTQQGSMRKALSGPLFTTRLYTQEQVRALGYAPERMIERFNQERIQSVSFERGFSCSGCPSGWCPGCSPL